MNPQKYLIPIGIMLFCMGKTLGCLQRNISCNYIKTANGFNFSHECPERSAISVVDNQTLIAHAQLIESFQPSNEVISINNRSVITRHCRDLQVTCLFNEGEYFVNEFCMEYKVIETTAPDPIVSSKPQGHTIGVSVGVTFGIIGIIGIIGILCWRWKKLKKEQCAATCFRKGTSQAEAEGTGQHDGSEFQVIADGLGTRSNGAIRLDYTCEISSAADPRGSGENGDDTEQDDALRSVHVHRLSIDPEADGKTPQSLSLDHNLSNEGIQPSKNGDVSAPDVNRASNHRAMHRSMRDDPGGVNDNQGKVGIRDRHNGWTLGDRGPEDHKNEGHPLLLSHRVEEAVALVNKLGFDPDQVSRCSSAPDTDVESLTTQHEELHTYDINAE